MKRAKTAETWTLGHEFHHKYEVFYHKGAAKSDPTACRSIDAHPGSATIKQRASCAYDSVPSILLAGGTDQPRLGPVPMLPGTTAPSGDHTVPGTGGGDDAGDHTTGGGGGNNGGNKFSPVCVGLSIGGCCLALIVVGVIVGCILGRRGGSRRGRSREGEESEDWEV